MRILIVGASGFIGSAVAARLADSGHHVATVSRSSSASSHWPHFAIDMARATSPADWSDALKDVDAVVNCAGVFQDGSGDALKGVNLDGAKALFAACERSGVRRVIHISAAGVEREVSTEFSHSKRESEAALMTRDLDWIILRPGVVIGRAAYGGSALVRGLAALPVLPMLPHTEPVQTVHLDDLVDTIVFFLRPEAPTKMALDIVGPKRWRFEELVGAFRRWMRWRRAAAVSVPAWLAKLMYNAGDIVRALGWRTPITSTARREMMRGATGDTAPWRDVTGIAPRDIETTLLHEPASVQERWFARMYILKPVIFGVFGLFWVATGLISLGPGYEYGMSLLREGGVPEHVGIMTLVAGALADIVIGLAILYRPTSRYGLYAALLISIVYVIVGTALVPRLWADPLGPMLKIWPVLVLNLVALAIREDR
jgi:uncharacterized protein YbjT (DUF2867 family)